MRIHSRGNSCAEAEAAAAQANAPEY
eukprot:COSAG06_NODE_63018_length_263_cov_0.926829_1_plen_25_part_01